MSEITDEQLAVEADYFERSAARSERAAVAGQRDAADPSKTAYARACAARAAEIARENAAEYRLIAADLRVGEIPDCLDLSDLADGS
ncbi:hypothetical protein [Streptomyces sp. 8L]|uniref:hypothetical protein n=1 Tax=Streptomyces sp. 8L TaxID=2877242 RepID=UPI001CD72011|nr:hypothetical protein [Streptomyces sp. 8L]MCA1222195.1 hypothetical protein [Streptomyces sp. 8L]